MEQYITEEEFRTFIEDIKYKLENKELDSISLMLEQMNEDTKNQNHFIDRTYIGEVKAKRKKSRIEDIVLLLERMSDKQVENVHKYTVDEFHEPDHEAEALDAIMKLSHKMSNSEGE